MRLSWLPLPLIALQASGVQAHSFGEVHSLPIPFRLYAGGAMAALIASFLVFGLFARRGAAARAPQDDRRGRYTLPRACVATMRALSLALLGLSIATGWWGTPNPYANFNMTAFWVLFLLGFAYATVLIGDVFGLINPWRTLVDALERAWPGSARGVLRAPQRFGYAPAIVLYLALIGFELLGDRGPRNLAHALAAYSAICVIGSVLWGASAWFRYGECFAVMFSLIARMAPIGFVTRDDARTTRHFNLRWPGEGLFADVAPARSLLLFLLAMLAATAFDGLHETEVWYRLYWLELYPQLLAHWLGPNPLAAFPALRTGYLYWQTAWLLLFPLIYFAAYWLAIRLMAMLLRTPQDTTLLARRFALSLLPIVLVYHVSHYFTLLYAQAPAMLPLLSDPFGWGQDWFGTARMSARVNTPDVVWVWNVQVQLIVAGHIASVCIAHAEALRNIADRRLALLSQLPMLLLMLALTVGGLWILSQPFQAGR